MFRFFFIFIVCGTVRSQGTDVYIYHSFQAMPSSSVIKVLKVQKHLNCAFSCSTLSGCRSFNFAHKKDKSGKHLCQLLPSDIKSNALQTSDVFHFYEKLNPDPCRSHPCQNGGKCVVMAGARDFTCICSPQFKGRYCELENWTKLNSSPVCFAARDNKYGSLSIQQSGVCIQIKLVYLWGYVTCNTSDLQGRGKWGCVSNGKHQFLTVVITDASNNVLLPGSDAFLSPTNRVYNLPGVSAKDSELVYPELPGLFPVTSGQIYRVWFGQDLDNYSEADNNGTVCVAVYCIYQ